MVLDSTFAKVTIVVGLVNKGTAIAPAPPVTVNSLDGLSIKGNHCEFLDRNYLQCSAGDVTRRGGFAPYFDVQRPQTAGVFRFELIVTTRTANGTSIDFPAAIKLSINPRCRSRSSASPRSIRQSPRQPTFTPTWRFAVLCRCKADYNARLVAAGLKASREHLVFANPNIGARRGEAWDPTAPWVPTSFRQCTTRASRGRACPICRSRRSVARHSARFMPRLGPRFRSSSAYSGTRR